MAKNNKSLSLFLGLIVILLVTSFTLLGAKFALAQNFGLNQVNAGLNGALSATDPRIIIGRIIQWALGFLGVIAVGLIIYAGFLWTTSNGEEEKIAAAKNILKNAIIGLVIIMSSWGIATFLISRLMAATGANGNNGANSNGGGALNSGVGAIGGCTISTTYPSSGQTDVPRNTSIMVTFKEDIQTNSVCVNSAGTACACDSADCNKINPLAVRLYKTELGDACSSSFACPNTNANVTNVLVSVSGANRTLVLMPVGPLGSGTANTGYTVKLTNQLKKTDGTSMFRNCSTDFAQWDFTVNTKFDLTPPIVAPAGVFPLPDNQRDLYKVVTPAAVASGAITVNSCPNTYAPAALNSVTPNSATVALNYHGALSSFKILVPADAPDKAQLFDASNNLLGIADFNGGGTVVFANFFTLTAASHPAGSLWNVSVSPERLADTLTINDAVYTFAASGANNNIAVPAACNVNTQAANIQAKLSGNDNVNVGLNGTVVGLTAKIAGTAGNSIAISTSNTSALSIRPLSAGHDRQELNQTNDRPDRPMNSAIQINFNKAINPVTISGKASEVANYVKVVNANASSSAAGVTCSQDSDCRSYSCQNGVCIGNYLGGTFKVSNSYKTLEFISDNKCGVNGCGEEIYCLPAASHLAVELVAANLKSCASNADCAAFAPFNNCALSALGYQTCQDSQGHNYPLANIANLDGIVDAANNSFDGNRSAYSDGPVGFYDDNYDVSVNAGKGDKYRWSFYVSDQIMLTPPQITSITPNQGQSGVSLADPVTLNFNGLMLNSTLDTGSITVNNGTSTVSHKLINLRSSAPSALGYWITSENKDSAPLDGAPDITIAQINHSPFAESLTFRAQVGSGVKDIYQNCYKPSVGPGCQATDSQPSCCFGSATAVLGSDGNCQ